MKTQKLIFVIVFFCSGVSFGQGKWTHYSKNDGLASTWVRDCVEDKQGNMWFATDKGLNKFDGLQMEGLTKADGLPIETLMKLFVDQNGVIWFTIEPPNNFADLAGPVLDALVTRGNGWGRYDGNELVAFMNKNSSDYLSSHMANVDGVIWIGGVHRKSKAGYFLMDYDGKTFNTVSQLGGTDLLPVNYFYCQGEDDIWFSSPAENGDFIHHFDGSTLTSYGEKDGLPSRNMYQFIKTIVEDSNGNLWFGASYEGKTGGLMKFDGTTWTTYSEDHGMTGKSINQIIEDKDGNIWVATNKGLNVFDGDAWVSFSKRDVLPNDVITEMKVDSRGRVWIGTMDGLLLFDHGKWSTTNKKNGLTHSPVRSIFEDSKGNIWVGAASSWKWGGISVFDGNQWNPFDFRDVYTTKFFEDSKGDMWVLSIGNGVFKYEL